MMSVYVRDYFLVRGVCALLSWPVAHSEIMKGKTAWQARERMRMRWSHINIINIGLHIKL